MPSVATELKMKKQVTFASVIGTGILMATAAIADPYNPGERAVGGGLLGAATTPARPRSAYRHHCHYVHYRYY
jgi:hypothetical protein